ncbi:PaaI family thioesterase [Streptomyces griseorubiginosus]|uniref:PaaI family thioesterase n=1 Tax=Streptomyces griseorubiginosus TaxID=67304 RepID=UPI002E8213EF|nr:PaaI family thioesterase [Streptomyces griseorubiginosus]WUB49002.1 PaaI family thioesterase [Streptomyces griseorubiginosus]WUB57529.1 PaaI family thioesterase [Streptomyces griseorubiginosus]
MHTSLPEPPTTGSTGATGPIAEELELRKAAITRLGTELRALVEATVRTDTTPDTLRRVADGVRHLTGELTGRRRARAEIPDVDEFPAGARMYSPVVGAGSPLAPPVVITPTGDGLLGRCTLGIAHEGPPGYGHGGMSAMLLDELMGRACANAGAPGLTVSLEIRYHRPVPLETPLRIHARVTGREHRKIQVTGSITTESAPAVPLATGEALFVTPDPEQARVLFPGMREEK